MRPDVRASEQLFQTERRDGLALLLQLSLIHESQHGAQLRSGHRFGGIPNERHQLRTRFDAEETGDGFALSMVS